MSLRIARPASLLTLFPIFLLFNGVLLNQAAGAQKPENLALKARATATSEYSGSYLARFAIDGKVPTPMSKADLNKAWVVKGAEAGNAAVFTLAWEKPITVAEIVYWGRTGWDWNESWKDFAVFLDRAAQPVVTGTLKKGHGPQPIRLPKPASAQTLIIKFSSSYGGPNPGASEIQVFSQARPSKAHGKFMPPFDGNAIGGVPVTIEESPTLAARLANGGFGFSDLLVVQRHHITCSHVYTYHCEGQKNGGGLFLFNVKTGKLKELLSSRDGQIAGCDLSYDGRQILVSWRKGEYYQVYKLNIDGTGLTQLTQGDHHNYDACWLPDGDIVYLTTERPRAAYCFFTPVGILNRMRPDGSGQQLISANFLNDFTPAVMNNGRIIYGRWEYVDRPAIPIQSLWTINPDGTGLSAFFGNRVLDPASFIEPQPIPNSTKILCTLTGHNGSCRGAIGIIDPSRGNNAQEAIQNLTLDVPLRGIEISSNGPRGPYQTPYPIDQTHFLVSYHGTVLLRDYEGTELARVVEPVKGLGFYNARPVRSRPRPPVYPNRTVAHKAIPGSPAETAWATVFVKDIYNGLKPQVKQGEIKQICVVEELPRTLIDSRGIRKPAFDFQRVVVSCGATYVPKKVWGYVDVNDDGSALFKVPARKAIYFMAIDAQGRAVQRMRSFTHLMPGEVQGCVGCHEPRSETSHVIHRPMAVHGNLQELKPPEWGLRGFNYAAIVQPVLDRHCVKCHKTGGAPKGLELTGDTTDYFNVSYEMLARGRKILYKRYDGNEISLDNPYTNWIPTYNGQERNILAITPKTWGSPRSRLADLVLAGHPDAKGKHRIQLSGAERQRILAWIDLNVPYYGTAHTAYPENQACRRLYPDKLNPVLADVAKRRCASCHGVAKDKHGNVVGYPLPRKIWTRIANPHLNGFLQAPLARKAGGTQSCGKAIFESIDDPDYQTILKTFQPVLKKLEEIPRMDMEGAKPAACCPHCD